MPKHIPGPGPLSGAASPSSATLPDVRFLALLLLSLGLRLWGAGDIPLKFWDDIYTLQFSLKPFEDIYRYIKDQPFDGYVDWQSPLTNYLTALFLLAGKSDVSARLVSIIPGALAPPMVYLLGSRLFSRRAGFIAGLLLAVNLFHIEHSQQVRCYALYLTLSLVSLHAFHGWITDRRRRWLLIHAASTSMLLYTSYLSASTIGVELAWLGFICLKRLADDKRSLSGLMTEFWPLLASFGACLLIYSPWLPNHMAMYELLKGAKGNPDVAVAQRLMLTTREMMSYWSGVMGYPGTGVAALALASVGLAASLLKTPRAPALFTLCWLCVSTGMVVGFNREALHAKTRYLLLALPALLLFAGAGIEAMGSAAGRLLARWTYAAKAGTALAMAAAFLGVTLFDIGSMPFFYKRDDDRLKDMCFDLTYHGRDIQYAGVWGSDSKWTPGFLRVILDWYLPGRFENPGVRFDRSYRRSFLLTTPESSKTVAAMPGAVPLWPYGKMSLGIVGLANHAPLVVWPNTPDGYSHEQDFSSLSSYSEAWNIENLFIDAGRISLADRSRPGSIEYAFVTPEGLFIESFALGCQVAMQDTIAGPPDSSVRIEVRPEGGQPAVVFEKALERDGAGAPRATSKAALVDAGLDLGEHVRGLKRFTVRIQLDPGTRLGSLNIRRLSFQAGLSGRSVQDPAGVHLANLAGNTKTGRWDPDAPLDASKLYLFQTGESGGFGGGSAGSARELKLFLERYPNAGVAASFTSPLSGGRVEAYDPFLAGPAALAASRTVRIPGLKAGEWAAAEGLFGEGEAGRGVLPGRGWANFDASGAGAYLFSPLFLPGKALPPGLEAVGGLVQHQNEACLTCKDAAPCSAIYRFHSEQGFTAVDLVYYPRWQADRKFKNSVNVLWSLDGKNWRKASSVRGWGSGQWEGWRVPRRVSMRPEAPARDVYLRFELSGDGTQIWSTAEHPMRVLLKTPSGWNEALPLPETGAGTYEADYRYQLIAGSPPLGVKLP